MRLAACSLACALAALLSPGPLAAQTEPTSQKIQLMAETLRARDAGDLVTARAKAEELIRIAPDDEGVQRLLASISDEIERNDDGAPVYGRAVGVEADEVMAADAARARNFVYDEDARIASAGEAVEEAGKLAELGAYDDASALLSRAHGSLELNPKTAGILSQVESAQRDVALTHAQALADAGQPRQAEQRLADYRAAGGNSREAELLAGRLEQTLSDPYALDIAEVSPGFVEQSALVRDLLTRGRAQYLNGDYDGAAATFKAVEARDANNAEAKFFLTEIAEILGEIHGQNRYKTRQQMLTEVDQNWDRPKVFDVERTLASPADEGGGTLRKLNSIRIPQVNFSGMELTRVIETLSELSVEFDPDREGVNIVPLFNPNEVNPRVNISLRNLSLDRILEFVTQQVNFAYDVGVDAVTVSPSDASGGNASMVTEFFPITRATVIRLTGFRDGGGGGERTVDPFAPPRARGGATQNDEAEALRGFFQNAGVNFNLPGASMAFDGEQLIVTQSTRNLERLRTILRNYNEVKQVEIEAKFLEVNQGDLEEVGFDWLVQSEDGDQVFVFNPSSLADSFGTDADASSIVLNPPVPGFAGGIPSPAPTTAGTVDLGSDVASNVFSATGWSVNGYDVDFAIRALSRKTGSDLMSAPKVTVLSGKRATITVAQELRYPESYGDIESTVSSGGDNQGNAAVSITAGTPQDFVTRNVGVEMAVTPNVENDDTISLLLEPRVTEFEGFVEYGGPSIALSGSISAVVPAGFYQPVFSTREVTTEVTVFDGATIVMGGLTREEVKSVSDKVPVLGDLPGIGRLFRSEGESTQKRNLLIFVTANLISPGGSPAKQRYTTVQPNSLFQNPVIQTPGGAANRGVDDRE